MPLIGARSHGRTPPGTPTIEQRWTAAKARGDRMFDPGVACVHGHDCPRFTNCGMCVECKRQRECKKHRADPSRNRASAKRSRDRDPEKSRKRRRDWGRANPGRVRALNNEREAGKRDAQTGSRESYSAYMGWTYSAELIACYWCGAATTKGARHRDHIIPIARGGTDSVGNLCVSCPDCNLRKNAQLPEEFSGQSELRFA